MSFEGIYYFDTVVKPHLRDTSISADVLRADLEGMRQHVWTAENKLFALEPPDPPAFTVELSADKVRSILLAHALVHLHWEDVKYATTAKDEWWHFLTEMRNRLQAYIAQLSLMGWDCDDWSRRVYTQAINWHLIARAKEWLPMSALGMVVGLRQPGNEFTSHKWVYVIDSEERLWFHEPQPYFRDVLFMWEPGKVPGWDMYRPVREWWAV